MVQATVPDESRMDLFIHVFWKWGTTTIFDKLIVNLDAGSYLCHTSVKALATVGEGGKGQVPPDLYGA